MSKIEHLSDSVTLYLGDCRDVLPTVSTVDALITSPPYAQQRDYGAPIIDWSALVRALSTTMMKRHGKLAGCISYCQRHMGVGWSHALRIIEYLEACGIVRRDDVSGDFIPGPSWDGRTHQ